MSDTIYEYEHPGREDARRNDYDERLEAFQGFGPCPMCGSPDGMQELLHCTVANLSVDKWDLWSHPNYDHSLFTPCPFCETNAEGYESMTTEEVEEWLEGNDE